MADQDTQFVSRFFFFFFSPSWKCALHDGGSCWDLLALVLQSVRAEIQYALHGFNVKLLLKAHPMSYKVLAGKKQTNKKKKQHCKPQYSLLMYNQVGCEVIIPTHFSEE